MVEQRKSWSIPVASNQLITVFNGTKQVLTYLPKENTNVLINVEVVEMERD